MLRCPAILLFALVLAGCAGTAGVDDTDMSDAALRARAERLMRDVPLIDGHNDTPWQYRKRVQNQVAELDFAADLTQLDDPMHTDIPRLREGIVGGQFWSVFIPIRRYGGADDDARTVIEQIDFVHRLAARYPDDLEIAYTADDIVRIHADGKIASLMGMEGGHSISNSLAVLRATYELGARYMTITHSISTTWADSATDETRVEGLTEFGRAVIREMNRIGMIVDLSHVSPATMLETLEVTVAPVIFSHSSAKTLCNHDRNVPDNVLEQVRENNGVVMVTFVPSYLNEDLRLWIKAEEAERLRLSSEHPGQMDPVETGMGEWLEANPRPECTLYDVADHIDHVRNVAGIEHVGIGSDYDGIGELPIGLEDVSTYPDLIVELLRRGYSDSDIQKVIGLNVLRVMRDVERTAARLQRLNMPASDALIEQLDKADAAGPDADDG